MMRLLPIAILVGTLGTAHADRGFYIHDTFGATDYKGRLQAYGGSAMRVQAGLEFRNGDRAYSFLGGGVTTDPARPYCDTSCETFDGGWSFVGVDFTQRWDVFPTRHRRIGVRFALSGGPRYYWGDDALTGYSGVGASGAAAIEADVGVIGFSLVTGVDVMQMSMRADDVTGTAPYLSLGVKLGWL